VDCCGVGLRLHAQKKPNFEREVALVGGIAAQKKLGPLSDANSKSTGVKLAPRIPGKLGGGKQTTEGAEKS